jgi:hypothetical protein
VTAVEMPTDGVYWMRPYDLEAMGAEGAAIAAANKRYVWFMSSDHHAGTTGYIRGDGIWRGFSSDPGVLPTDWTRALSGEATVGAPVTGNHVQMETPWIVYNPDDATYPFYLYAHGVAISDGARGQDTLLFKSADLVTFTTPVVSHATTGDGGHTGYQIVYRLGVNNWESYGLGGLSSNSGTISRWTSTDGATFTKSNDLTRTVSGRTFTLFQGAPHTTFNGQRYSPCREENTSGTLAAVENDGDLTATANDDSIIATRTFSGVQPTSGFVQGVTGYEEDGVYHMWLRRGYFATSVAPNKNDWTDYYSFITDATAAADAAPVGVRATCSGGVVSLQWYDALPHQNYRVARSSSASGPWTDLADVTGLSYSDNSPTADAVNYYRVTTLNSGEQGSRIVSTYASTYGTLANKHVTRALSAGANISTIDVAWVDTVADWLTTNNLTSSLVSWCSPSFGITYSSAPSVDRIMDLSCVTDPYKSRDAKAVTTDTRYSATGVSGSVPGISPNGNANAIVALQHFNFNPTRQKAAVTAISVFNPEWTFDAVPIGYMEISNGWELRHQPGSDRIRFRTGITSTADAFVSAPDTGDIFAAGVWAADGTTTAYCNGTMGTPVAGTAVNYSLSTTRSGRLGSGDSADILHPIMGADVGGSAGKWRPSTQAYLGGGRARVNWSDIIIFSTALTEAQLDDLYSIFQTRLA